MQTLTVIGIIVEIVILFNFMILVHELGHYLAARWRGLQIDKFQIWFGKPIWSKTIGGVQWGMGWIPAGGFVALPQMAPMEMLEGQSDKAKPMEPIKPIDKIIVAFAGPLFSFALALFFAFVVWGVKRPISKSAATTTIGYIAEKAVAGADQLQIGDEILEVDGRMVKSWGGMVDSVAWNTISSGRDTVAIKVKREGVSEPITIALAAPDLEITAEGEEKPSFIGKFFKRPELRRIELMGVMPESQPMVGKLFKDSPAALAGLQPNDVFIKANGEKVTSAQMVGKAVKATPGEPVAFVIRRDGQEQNVHILAKMPENAEKAEVEDPMLGIGWDLTGETTLERTPAFLQIKNACLTMYNTLAAVFSPSSSISAKHLSGPVGIMRVYYLLFEDKDGWRRALWFSVILNINLAILNMMPLPVLDGGHIVMSLVESVRKRPISKRFLELSYGGCAIFLIGFMIFITGFDVTDIFGGGSNAPVRESPIFKP
jgi:regulator of sigma E protease